MTCASNCYGSLDVDNIDRCGGYSIMFSVYVLKIIGGFAVNCLTVNEVLQHVGHCKVQFHFTIID